MIRRSVDGRAAAAVGEAPGAEPEGRERAQSKPAASAPPRAVPTGTTRRRLLGGALAAALATLVVPARLRPTIDPDRWKGKTRWIGHC